MMILCDIYFIESKILFVHIMKDVIKNKIRRQLSGGLPGINPLLDQSITNEVWKQLGSNFTMLKAQSVDSRIYQQIHDDIKKQINQ